MLPVIPFIASAAAKVSTTVMVALITAGGAVLSEVVRQAPNIIDSIKSNGDSRNRKKKY
ncbi:MAG: hypothetical protein IJP68_06050 [Selenomonadaceae bacterium]|nr:hypothetical protein [Selenomonadaceae bacterium]